MSQKKIRKKPPKVDLREIKLEELKAIIDKTKTASLSEEDSEKLEAAVETLAFLTNELEKKGVSINRLRQLLFGASTEKTSQIFKDTGKNTDSAPGSAPGDVAGKESKEKKKLSGLMRVGDDSSDTVFEQLIRREALGDRSNVSGQPSVRSVAQIRNWDHYHHEWNHQCLDNVSVLDKSPRMVCILPTLAVDHIQ